MSSLLSLSSLPELQNFCDSRHSTLVMFSSPECAPCKLLKLLLEKAARKYPADEIGFVHIELNENNRELANFYNVASVPMIIFFNQITPVAYKTGFKSETDVVDWLSERIK
jgi:thiol-disulfide isomerase/thioredoxin